MDRQNSQIILNEEYDTFGISKRLSIPYTSSLEAVAGTLPNVISSPIAPSAISSGQATAEIKQVQGVYYANKTSFSDTTAGYRFGIDSDGIAKFYFGDATGYIKWDGTTLTIAGLTGFIATGGAAADVNAYGTTINGGKITTGTITATQLSTTITYAGNIVLDTSGAIRSGQTAYDTGTGFWLGDVSGTKKFSIGNSAGNKFIFDGTNVSLTGAITSTSGTIGGWTLGATSLIAGSGSTTVGLDSGGTNPAFYAGNATPGSAPFRVSNAGALICTSFTMTGGTLRTAASGARIEINSSDGFVYFDGGNQARININGEFIDFLTSSGTDCGSIGGTTTGELIIDAPDRIVPGSLSGDAVDFGKATLQWKDFYLNKIIGNSGGNVIDLSLSGYIATNQVFQFKNASGDPTGYEGGVYFNTTTNKLRVYAGGAWVDLH